MRLHSWRFGLTLPFILLAAGSTTASAQTDVALSLLGAFSHATTYDIGLFQQRPAHAAGGLFEFRHISSPLVGYEATYSYNRANQAFAYIGTAPAGSSPCPPSGCGPTGVVSANAQQIAGDWLISARVARLRPFALAGAGLLFNEPTGATGSLVTTSSKEPVYVYGFGLDWKLRPYLGFRLQYRGNVYRAPDVTSSEGSNGSFTHTAEPMIGVYFKL